MVQGYFGRKISILWINQNIHQLNINVAEKILWYGIPNADFW